MFITRNVPKQGRGIPLCLVNQRDSNFSSLIEDGGSLISNCKQVPSGSCAEEHAQQTRKQLGSCIKASPIPWRG